MCASECVSVCVCVQRACLCQHSAVILWLASLLELSLFLLAYFDIKVQTTVRRIQPTSRVCVCVCLWMSFFFNMSMSVECPCLSAQLRILCTTSVLKEEVYLRACAVHAFEAMTDSFVSVPVHTPYVHHHMHVSASLL